MSSLHSIGVDYSALGQYEEALETDMQVYETRKRILGEEHPDTLDSLHNIGAVYCDLGQYEKAQEIFERMHIQR